MRSAGGKKEGTLGKCLGTQLCPRWGMRKVPGSASRWWRATKFLCVNSEPALWRCRDYKPLPHGFTQPKEEGGSFAATSEPVMPQPPFLGPASPRHPFHSPACWSAGQVTGGWSGARDWHGEGRAAGHGVMAAGLSAGSRSCLLGALPLGPEESERCEGAGSTRALCRGQATPRLRSSTLQGADAMARGGRAGGLWGHVKTPPQKFRAQVTG